MASKRDYYEVLGVARDATVKQITEAYRKLALANHPDRNPGDAQAETRFKEAAEAFEVLGDEEKRHRYDRYGHQGLSGTGFHEFTDVNDIFDAFGDIFGGGLFGDLFGGRRRRGPARGNDLRCDLEIDLFDAARGATHNLEFQRHEFCGDCGGSGAKSGTKPETCRYCGGRGQVIQSQGFFRVQSTCPSCQGAGSKITQPCGKCRGTGRVAATRRIDVRIPPGVDTGMRLCLRGEGEVGQPGGPRGDLYCYVHVADHPLFERQGSTILCRVPITFPQAALGGEIEVPTLDGREHLTIAAGTQTGERIRLRGKGMPNPRGGGRGDQFVEVFVETPHELTKRQEELLRELAELDQQNVSPHRKTFFEKLREYFVPESPVATENK
jgi:molecular chaperone DnaJ